MGCKVWADFQSEEREGLLRQCGGCRKEPSCSFRLLGYHDLKRRNHCWPTSFGRKTARWAPVPRWVFHAYHTPCSWKACDQKRKKGGTRSPNFLRPPGAFQLLSRRKKFCLWETSLWAVEVLSKKGWSLNSWLINPRLESPQNYSATLSHLRLRNPKSSENTKFFFATPLTSKTWPDFS